jgi:Tfp pilus assembly PilM family ATPase
MKNKRQNGLYVAFDIGTVSIKAVVIDSNDSSQRLAAIEEEALKPASAFPGEDEHRSQIVSALKNIASRLPIKDCRSVSALFANRELQVKIIELPSQVQSDQIEKVLGWEAKKLLSPNYREEPYAFSYRVIRQNPFSVALAVIPQRLLEKFIELFELAGIKLDGTFGEVFAAQSLKDIIDISGLPALSIVNLGQTGTHLQIFSAGELKFYRFIPSGLSEMSTPPKDSELEMYSQKIRFSFDYFRAVSKLSQIDCLFFMGGGAAQPGILPFERNYFNPTRVNIVDISSGIDISPMLPDLGDNAPAEEKQRRLLPFIPAVGSALATLSPEGEKMNLSAQLKNRQREKRLQELSKQLPLWLGILGCIASVLILFSMKGQQNLELKEISEQLERTRVNTEAARMKIAKYKSAADIGIKLSLPAKKALEPILKSRMSIAHALKIISDSKPEGLRLDEILVRTAAESEGISLENQQNETVTEPTESGEPAQEAQAGFTSLMDSASTDAEALREGLIGKILVIRGLAQNHEELGKFSEELVAKKLIIRFKNIISRKNNRAELEFLLKGEMP